MPLQGIAELVHELRSGPLRHLAPRVTLEGPASAGDGGVHIRFVGIDGVSDDFAGSGRDDRKRLPHPGGLFRSIDEKTPHRF